MTFAHPTNAPTNINIQHLKVFEILPRQDFSCSPPTRHPDTMGEIKPTQPLKCVG